MTDLHENAQRLAAEGHTVTLEVISKEGVEGITEVLHHYPISCIQCQSELRARTSPSGESAPEKPNGKGQVRKV